MATMVLQPVDLDSKQQQDYADLLKDAADVVDEPDFWLITAHPMLGAKSPAEVAADGNKELVLDLLKLIREGAFT